MESLYWYDSIFIIPPPAQKSCWGVYWFHFIRPSVCLSVRPSPKLYVMPRYVTKPRISSTGSSYYSTNCTRNISPKNGCWQPWRNVAGRTPGLWKNTGMGWTIIWPMIVGALIHEAGTMIQAPKQVCQFMAEDIPPPVLNQLVIRYLVNLLVRIKEPTSPTGWQQSPQPQAEDTKKSRKLDCIATGFIYDDAVNFTVDVRPASRVRSVAPTVLVGSISYLYILFSNFRMCCV